MNEFVYGIHSVRSILNTHPKRVLKIYLLYGMHKEARLTELMNDISKYNITVEEHRRQWLDWRVKGAVHQGIVAKIMSMSLCLKNERDLCFVLKKSPAIPLILVLDGVTDPHNLGACLRSADAAGVNLVILPRNRSAKLNSTVRKVSSGSSDRVPCMQVTNLSRTLRLLKQYNVWVIGTVIGSTKIIFKSSLKGPVALVMGSEGSGMRDLTKKNCDELVSIPMSRFNMSLNISVAAGVCLFEILRQRNYQV